MKWDKIEENYWCRSWARVRRAVWCFFFHRVFYWHREAFPVPGRASRVFCVKCREWWVDR